MNAVMMQSFHCPCSGRPLAGAGESPRLRPASLPAAGGSRRTTAAQPPSWRLRSMSREQEACPGAAPLLRSAPQRAAVLSRVLGVSHTEFMHMVDQEPRVFEFTAEALECTVGAIADLCAIRPSQLPPLVMLQPRVLLQPDLLREHFLSLMQQLGLPRAEVQELVRRCPQLLALPPPHLRQQLQLLEDLLLRQPTQHKPDNWQQGGSSTRPGAAAAAAPPSAPLQLQPQFHALVEAVCQWPPLLLQEGPVLLDWLQLLASQLPAPRAAVTRLLLGKPSLLGIPAQLVLERLQYLARRSGRSLVAAVEAAVEGEGGFRGQGPAVPKVQSEPSVLECVSQGRGPDLVAVSSCFINRRAKELMPLLQLQHPQEFYQMLLASPSLMQTPLGSLANKWRTLQAILRLVPGAQQQQGAGPHPAQDVLLGPGPGPGGYAGAGAATSTVQAAAVGLSHSSPQISSGHQGLQVQGHVDQAADHHAAASSSSSGSSSGDGCCCSCDSGSGSGDRSCAGVLPPAGAGGPALRAEHKAALLTASFSCLARLKYLVLLRAGALGGEGGQQQQQQQQQQQGDGQSAGAGGDGKGEHYSRMPGGSLNLQMGEGLELEQVVEEVLGTSDTLFLRAYPGYSAWLEG